MNLEFGRGSHVCHFYETAGEQRELSLRFLAEGLRQGEHCIYIATDPSVEEWLDVLHGLGIDAGTKLRQGTLETLSAREWYPQLEFNSLTMGRRFWRTINGALLDSGAVRLIADMRWTSQAELPVDQLCHWEATANLVLDDTDSVTICQYDLRQHSPTTIHSALRTHPKVVLGRRTVSNPYYEAPEILDNEPNSQTLRTLMLLRSKVCWRNSARFRSSRFKAQHRP